MAWKRGLLLTLLCVSVALLALLAVGCYHRDRPAQLRHLADCAAKDLRGGDLLFVRSKDRGAREAPWSTGLQRWWLGTVYSHVGVVVELREQLWFLDLDIRGGCGRLRSLGKILKRHPRSVVRQCLRPARPEESRVLAAVTAELQRRTRWSQHVSTIVRRHVLLECPCAADEGTCADLAVRFLVDSGYWPEATDQCASCTSVTQLLCDVELQHPQSPPYGPPLRVKRRATRGNTTRSSPAVAPAHGR